MGGIVCVLISCCLFIHLGMGDTFEKVLHIRFVLFRCAKCLSFWSTLGYSLLIVQWPVEMALCAAFLCAYAALWVSLLLGIIANVYEEINNRMDAEEPAHHETNSRDQENKGGEGKENPLHRV